MNARKGMANHAYAENSTGDVFGPIGTGHGLVYSGQGSTDGSGAYAMQPRQGEWPQTLAAQPTFTHNQYNQIL